MPAGGWAKAAPAIGVHGEDWGGALMRQRALLAVRVPALVVVDEALVRWRSEVPDLFRSDLVFYTDGSLFHLRFQEFSTAGRAVIIISSNGALLGVLKSRLSFTCSHCG